MNERANFFKIGLFVIGATGIALLAVILLGAGTLFQKEILLETYFDESVQGLDLGSPVKVRGVQVGKVKAITLVDAEYPTQKRYVLVRIALQARALGRTGQILQTHLPQEVARGLRIRMAFQGVTGMAFLEADYLPPEQAPSLDMDWQPIYPYVPSAPSTITRYTEAIDKILKNIEELDVAGTVEQITAAVGTLSRVADGARVDEISSQAIALMEELRSTNRRFETLLAGSEQPLEELFKTLPQLSQSLARSGQQLENLATQLPQDLAPFGRSLHQLGILLSAEQQNIQATLDNLRQTSENLRDLSESARAYPAQLLFSRPPPQTEPQP